ncbi:hypothetical protein VQ056_14070 [Paenibacillus sp. JTLBN-2024]
MAFTYLSKAEAVQPAGVKAHMFKALDGRSPQEEYMDDFDAGGKELEEALAIYDCLIGYSQPLDRY